VSIDQILAAVDSLPIDSTLAESDSIIAAVRGYGVPLSLNDSTTIRRFHGEFVRHGLGLRFTSTGRAPRYYYPTLRDLILEHDLDGRQASYLASEESWRFLKDLEGRDGIIPVVGNLAGSTAFPAIGREVAARGETVSALYVSNVEMYIWRDGHSAPSPRTRLACHATTDPSLSVRSSAAALRGSHTRCARIRTSAPSWCRRWTTLPGGRRKGGPATGNWSRSATVELALPSVHSVFRGA
jgi:hypothetical protein